MTMTESLGDELATASREVLSDLVQPSSGDPARHHDPKLWTRVAGWAAVGLPEEQAGIGGRLGDLGLVMMEAGRALLGLPVADSAVLLWLLAERRAGVDALAPRLLEGAELPAIAWRDCNLAGRRTAGGVSVSGEARYVMHGSHLTTLLVAPVQVDEELALVAIPAAGGPGVTWTDVSLADRTRQFAHARIDTVLGSEQVLAKGDGATKRWELARGIRCMLLAHEAVGASERLLEMSVTYANLRYQFGKPIGSFQAVKHRLADMMISVEQGRAAARHVGSVDPDSPEFLDDVAVARVHTARGYVTTAESAIQVHGGIAYTWELPLHLYYRRAATDRAFVWPLSEAEAHLRAELFGGR